MNSGGETGSHVMVVEAGKSIDEQYPSGPDPDATVLSVMWAVTPCQHRTAPTSQEAAADAQRIS